MEDMPVTVVLEHHDTYIAADRSSWAVAAVWNFATVKGIAMDGMKL